MVVTIGAEDKEYQLFKGEWVAKGKWLCNVPRAAHWYYVGEVEVLVRMQQTLNSNLDLAPHSDSNPLPQLHASTLIQVLPLNPVKLDVNDHDWMMDEILRREDFTFEETVDEDTYEELCDYDGHSDDESGSESESGSAARIQAATSIPGGRRIPTMKIDESSERTSSVE